MKKKNQIGLMKKTHKDLNKKGHSCPRGFEVACCGDCSLYMDTCKGNEEQWELEEVEEMFNGNINR